jgi:hypothetical protein
MNLNDFYPNPSEMVENEIRTVKFLSEDSFIKKYERFHGESKRSYEQYRSRGRGFLFASHFELFHSGMPGTKKLQRFRVNQTSNVRLIISALIEQNDDGSYGNISYALAVCRLRSKRSMILRKFHFDIVANTSGARRQPHPISHLQYCGEPLPIMDKLGYRVEQLSQLHTKMREPRLFFSPMSLALLLELTVREFGDQKFREFLLKRDWRNLVRENEALLLKPFYEKCAKVVSKADDKRNLLADEVYLG